MTAIDIDALIKKAMLQGTLTAEEQDTLAREVVIYRDMARRLERALHELIKEAEECR